MQEIGVQSLSQEDPLEEEIFQYSYRENSMDREEPGWLYCMELQKSRHDLEIKQQYTSYPNLIHL